MSITYKDAGVDIDKGDAFIEKIKDKVKATYGSRVKSGVGGFAALYEVGDRYLSVGADGVGTKLKLAQQLEIHNTIGIDLVAMCVNDILCTGATPLFFMDYLAMGELDVQVACDIVDGIVKGVQLSSMALIGGETAEMPGLYQKGDYDLAGFAVGEVFPDHIIDGLTLGNGDTLIGIASSGPHSNGFSLLRKILINEDKKILRKALTPTRIYADLVKKLRSDRCLPKGLAHITGGGLMNIARINKSFDYHLDKGQFPPEGDVFKRVRELSTLHERELHKTFNMGLGLVIATDKPKDVLQSLKEMNEEGFTIGHVTAGTGKTFLNGLEIY